MSFALTTTPFRNRTKRVTRRLKWLNLKAGDIVQGCVRCMGLKPGEKIERLGLIRIISARREPLDGMETDIEYGKAEAALEGFPDLTGPEFVSMFAKNMKVDRHQEITRIEYEYLDGERFDSDGPNA